MPKTCRICGCRIHRDGDYARPTVKGRCHATRHHFVPERFFGRSTNRRGTQREPIFSQCPWDKEGSTAEFCYECHEELLHNPVLLPADIELFARLVDKRGFSEDQKPEKREKIAGRIKLFHEIVAKGLQAILEERPA